jgi:hypothetical protein
VKKLKEVGIPSFVLADFDFFLRQLTEYFTSLQYQDRYRDELNALRSQLGFNSELPRKIIQHIQKLSSEIANEGLRLDEKTLRKHIKEPFRIKRLSQFNADQSRRIKEYLSSIQTENVYVLSGELEDFYTDSCKTRCHGISGKEEKPIYIVSRLVNATDPITSFIHMEEYIAFLDYIKAH